MNLNPSIDDYATRPLLVYWEGTRSCALACRHCRASAMPTAHPLELTREEGFTLLDQIAQFGEPMPHLVLTGGDPLRRNDVFEMIAGARSRGIDASITPAARPDLTRDVLWRLRDAGIGSVALSLDASTAKAHDDIRQVAGCYEKTMAGARWCGEAGIPLQINTLVSAETASDLPALFALLRGFPVMRWSLFFLISVGRGKELAEVTAGEAERIMGWVYEISKGAPFQIKTTEAPSYRRVSRERTRAEKHLTPNPLSNFPRSENLPDSKTAAARKLERGLSSGATAARKLEQGLPPGVRRGFGIRDGNGIVFISHIGDVYPSGFLPLKAGNVRTQSLVDIYRSSEVFVRVRDVDRFEGKCGQCEYRKICGGSRARAFAHTGNPAGSDPLCDYQPKSRRVALLG